MTQREILFKIYRDGKPVAEERLNGSQWQWRHVLDNPVVDYRWYEGVWGNAPDLIRCQYTGINDRNGVKIFHGDEYNYDLREGLGEPYKHGSKGEVRNDIYGGFGFTEYMTNIQVTGNIHQKQSK